MAGKNSEQNFLKNEKNEKNEKCLELPDLAEGLACADPGARTPIGASGNFCK